MGSATFFDAFDALSLAFVLPVLIGLWHLSPVEIGFLISASYVGQLAGALIFGQLAEKHGRVRSAAAAVAIMSVMSLGCILASSFVALFLCRLVQGIGVGGEMPVAATYISELSRAQGRGRFFLLYEMIFPVGLMAAGQVGAWLVPLYGWQIMFLIGGIPGLIIFLLLLRLPESPRWLIGHGRLAEAERIIRDVEASTPVRLPARSPPVSSTMVASALGEPRRGRWRELLSPIYRRRTLIVWVLWASAFLVANSLNNWMPTLYRTVYGLGLQDALRAASLNNVAQVAVLLVCAFVIDRIGRRNWMMAAFVAGGVVLAVLSVASQQRGDGDRAGHVELRHHRLVQRRASISIRRRSIRRACARSAPASRRRGCASPRRSGRRSWDSWSLRAASPRCSCCSPSSAASARSRRRR